jgi:hypothetical protein
VTNSHDFTSSIKEMKDWLDQCAAIGGGDCPEAIADGLHDILKLSWREKSTKICILISDGTIFIIFHLVIVKYISLE